VPSLVGALYEPAREGALYEPQRLHSQALLEAALRLQTKARTALKRAKERPCGLAVASADPAAEDDEGVRGGGDGSGVGGGRGGLGNDEGEGRGKSDTCRIPSLLGTVLPACVCFSLSLCLSLSLSLFCSNHLSRAQKLSRLLARCSLARVRALALALSRSCSCSLGQELDPQTP
jgi:hypothetical protein